MSRSERTSPIASGSRRANAGTAIVPNASSASAARQIHSSRVSRMRAEPAPLAGTARVEQGKGEICGEVREDHERRVPYCRPEHDRIVARGDGGHHETAHARPGEDALDEDRS